MMDFFHVLKLFALLEKSMIYAELKSKIPEVLNREDILTSNVFTLIKLLPDQLILQILRDLLPAKGQNILPKNQKIKCFDFWKKINGLKEPDIYIETDSGFVIIIEVKYQSPESSESQLKDYLDLFRTESKILLYLTADRTEPFLTTQKKQYKSLPIYWANWYLLNRTLNNVVSNDETINNILEMIITYLNHKKFNYFYGWNCIKNATNYDLSFYRRKEQNG